MQKTANILILAALAVMGAVALHYEIRALHFARREQTDSQLRREQKQIRKDDAEYAEQVREAEREEAQFQRQVEELKKAQHAYAGNESHTEQTVTSTASKP